MPEEIHTQRREPAIRLKNPIAKIAFHKILKEKWKEIREMPFKSPSDRYFCYRYTLKDALKQVQNVPSMPPKVSRIIKLKQELKLVHL